MKAHTYFSFDVSLLEVTPRIWRQFLLRSTATFHDLHVAIQDAADWGNYHLYAFHESEDGPVLAGIPHDEDDEPDPDATTVKLAPFFRRRSTCLYQYDFGDNWWHEVRLDGVLTLNEAFFRRLLVGARAFPPEDCGGIPGYEDCVALRAGKPTEYDDAEGLRAWLGDWAPEAFNLDQAKQFFDRTTRPRRTASGFGAG